MRVTEGITTERLELRRWREADRLPFQRLNADPRVMEFMPGPLDPGASDELIDRIERHFARHGFGLWAAELRQDLSQDLSQDRSFAGFIGLSVPGFVAGFMPAVEIGWRLRADCWGRGLATEGARAVVAHAFTAAGLASLVSFTAPANLRSRRVMEKIGMSHDASGDFDHPLLPAGHPLRRHVLYRIDRDG